MTEKVWWDADHCDKRGISRVIEFERYAFPRKSYVMIFAKFGSWGWYWSHGEEQKTVRRLTRTLDGKGEILTLTGLRGELPGICIGKEGE